MTASHKKFKTEVQQLLDLVIHSLYSNREIFLRELISNASDAIDRVRFEALSNQDVLEDDPEWKIRITVDKKAKTLTVADNGLGMQREEVEKNIGTIANSGTRRFLEAARKQEGALPPDLIGQFGVGFYSAFMVADKVTLCTRRAGKAAEGTYWESTGDGTYTIDTVEKAKRGTEVVLHLKEGMEEFLDDWRIRKIIRKYSDFVEHPVTLVILGDEKAAKKDEDEEVINRRKAIWQRPKAEVTAEEYTEFYHHVSHDFQNPLEIMHWGAEGTTEFKALLYIPQKAALDFLMPEAQHRGIHLYVKRVFITDDCQELRPPYLRFLRGVVDSSDLPLNVSRELLQDNKLIRLMRTNLVKKVLDTLAEMKEKNRDKYTGFWNEFGRVLKEGIHIDLASRDKLQELLLFPSDQNKTGALISLREYVGKMPASQKEIYYALGENRQAIENSPHLEAFRRAAFDVLFLTDPIDEWVVQSLTSFADKPLKCVSRGTVDLPAPAETAAADGAEQTKLDGEMGTLVSFLKAQLGNRVQDVVLSKRLTDSACCLVFDEHAPGFHMEKILKSLGQPMPEFKGTLEINARNPVLQTMQQILGRDDKNPKLLEYAELLYDQAALTAGLPVADLLQFTRRVSRLMAAEGKAVLGTP